MGGTTRPQQATGTVHSENQLKCSKLGLGLTGMIWNAYFDEVYGIPTLSCLKVVLEGNLFVPSTVFYPALNQRG